MINRRQLIQSISAAGFAAAASVGSSAAQAQTAKIPAPKAQGGDNFYKSSKVRSERVEFHNIYGMRLVGDLFVPKNVPESKKLAALVISHPYGAVRQQAANLYATKLAEAGFLTLSFDQTFWGESGGNPRGSTLPDLYAENFSAAVDYVGTRGDVDRNRIGGLGVCASGGFVIAAAKIDPRIKAVATVSMFDMGEYFRTGVAGDRPRERLMDDLKKAAEQRWQIYESGQTIYGPGQNDPVFVESSESNDYYRTTRGFVASNDRKLVPANYVKLANFHPFENIDLIAPRPILFVVGDRAPSRCYSDNAYRLAAQPKELYVVKDANRTDLYDRVGIIPWRKLTDFFARNL